MESKLDWMSWYCGMEKFSVTSNGHLSVCFTEVFVMGITDYLIFLFCILYHALHLKWYHNYNGAQLKDQTKLSQIFLYLKCVCLLAIAFSWCWVRLNPQVIIQYPLRHLVSDFARFLSWMGVMTVVFLEWNRSRPHHWMIRTLLCISAINYCHYCYVLFADSKDKGYFSILTPKELKQMYIIPNNGLSESFSSYFKFVDASYFGFGFTACIHIFLALLSLVGAFPQVRNYLEANEKHSTLFNHKDENADEPPLTNALTLLVRQTVNRESGFWLLAASIVSMANGFFIQQVMKAFGEVYKQTSQPDFLVLYRSVVFLIGLFIALAVIIGLQAWLWGMASEKVVNGELGVRNRLFQHLLKQTTAYHHQIGTGGILSRFSQDAEMVKALINDYIPIFFQFLSLAIFGFYSMFQISLSSSLYLLTLIPLVHVVTYFQTELFVIIECESQDRISLIASKVQDTFSKYHTVLYYGKKNTTIHQYGENVYEIYVIQRFKLLLRSGFLVLTEFFGNAVTLLSYFIPLTIFNHYSLADGFANFVVFSLYSQNIIRGLSELIKLLPEIARVVGASATVLDMMQKEIDSPEHPDSSVRDLEMDQGVIEFKNVVFRYPKKAENDEKADNILKGISFKIKANSKVAIIGDSGAGKSTLFQIIGRFYDINGGEILIDGQDISKCSTASIRSHMAIVSQEHDLFSCSLLENILYGYEPNIEHGEVELKYDDIQGLLSHLEDPEDELPDLITRVMSVVREANCSDFITCPADLSKVLGEGGSGLSGGQKQRLTVARALFKSPKLLLLDEVTSALDPISEQVVQGAIDRLTNSRTVLIIAHRLHTIKNADLIIVMEKGNIVASGSHDEMMSTSEKYAAMVKAGDKYGTIGKINKNLNNEIPADLKALTEHVYALMGHNELLKKKYEKQLEHLIPTISDKKRLSLDGQDDAEFGKSLDKYRSTYFSESEASDSEGSEFEGVGENEGFEMHAENIKKSLIINTARHSLEDNTI